MYISVSKHEFMLITDNSSSDPTCSSLSCLPPFHISIFFLPKENFVDDMSHHEMRNLFMTIYITCYILLVF